MRGERLREARQRAGCTQERLAEALCIGQVSISKVERDVLTLSPEQVAIAARVLGAPELLVEHCDACPVANALMPVRYPTLDNVSLHPGNVATKLAEECREAATAAQSLFEVFNRLDWNEDPVAREEVAELLVQVRDAEVAIQILNRVLFVGNLLPMTVLQDVQERHRKKCEAKGYCKPHSGGDDGHEPQEAA